MNNIVSSVARAVRADLQSTGRGDDARSMVARHTRSRAEILGDIAPEGEGAIVEAVLAELNGLGPLQPLMDDPDVEEIWINRPDAVYVARSGVTYPIEVELPSDQTRHLVERMLRSTGRRIDIASPFVDASLPDGSRLHVVIPDITRQHWSVNIRKFSRNITNLADLVERESLSEKAAKFLQEQMGLGSNILVSGATQAGKTTMLNALLSTVGERERIVTVEETFELDIRARDVVAMQCRQPNLEGGGEVTLRRLIKESLRMRPDRLVVGEVREAESLDLLIALNSGLPGACTIHGNSARDALTKLCTLPLLAGRNIDSSFVIPTVASCIDLVVHCERLASGQRRVAHVVRVTGEVVDGVVETQEVAI